MVRMALTTVEAGSQTFAVAVSKHIGPYLIAKREVDTMTVSLSPVTNTGGGAVSEASVGSSQTTAFNNAVNTSTNPGLTEKGNTVDTGRYTISSSSAYTSPTSGAQANDGMVSIYDKQTGSYVEIFGDPHVYTSDGNRAQSQANGLTLNLGDGTQVHFQPTSEVNGVSHIQEVDISKGGQTVSETGFDSGSTGSTSSNQQGTLTTSKPGSSDTVLHTGQDGSLGTLYNASNTGLNNKTSEQSLDGMGGATSSGTTSSGTTSSAATEKQIAQIQQLISELQQEVSTGQAAGQNTQGTQSLVSLLEQLVSKLSGNSAGGGDMASLVNQLLPALEQKLGQLAQSGQGSSQEASSINQAISTLMGMASGGTATGSSSTGASTGAGSTSTTGTGATSTGSTSSGTSTTSSTNPYANYNPATSGVNLIDQALTSGFSGIGQAPDYDAWGNAANQRYQTQSGNSQTTNTQTGQHG